MGKNQSASNLTNVIQVSPTGNVLFVSGSTTLMSISSSGAITTTGVISGSNALSASYAANADTLDGLDSTVFTLTSSFNAQTASFTAFTASILAQTASLNSFSASILATTASLNLFSSSVLTFTGSAATRLGALEAATGSLYSYTSSLNLKTASFATTGSNTFIGTQTISGSVLQSGSFTTTGTIIAQTINVQTVTSSVIYSSGSNIFGNLLGDSQKFTGSVFITGSNIIANVGTACFSSQLCVGSSLVLGSNNAYALYLKDSAGNPKPVMATAGNTNLNFYNVCSTGKININNAADNAVLISIDNTGAACFASTITGTTIYGSTTVCSPVGYFSGCVGIGTIIPRDTFVVSGNGGAVLERFTGTDPYSGDLYFYSAKGTSTSPTTKANGDTAMGIRPRAYDGTSYLDVASIVSKIDGAVSTNVMSGNLIFSTNCGSTTLTERMRITSAGNVGIGTCSPSRKLIIQGGSTNAGLEILSTNGYRTAIIAGRGSSGTALDQGYFQMTDQGTAAVVLDTAGNSYVNGGNFGVKTTNPTSGLFQVGDAGITAQNTYFGSGQVRVGGGVDHGANTVFSVAPGVVTFDRPGVGGGALTINSSGYVTLPSQPSFLAAGISGQQDYTSSQVLVFGTTKHNVSSGYNTSTGRFTAPVAGRYLFDVNVYSYDSCAVAITIIINGSQWVPSDVVPLIYKPAIGSSVNLSTSIIFELAASDYVEVRSRSGYSSRVYMSHSHFSGQLLS